MTLVRAITTNSMQNILLHQFTQVPYLLPIDWSSKGIGQPTGDTFTYTLLR